MVISSYMFHVHELDVDVNYKPVQMFMIVESKYVSIHATICNQNPPEQYIR